MGKSLARGVSCAGALLVFLLFLSAARAQEEPAPVVKEIEFVGNKRYDDSTLRYLIRTKVGQRFSDAKLAEDVSTLLTRFERVTVQGPEPYEGGVRIKFIVEESPVITSVVLQGFKSLEVEEAKKLITSKEGYPFATFTVELDQQRLVDELRKKGHYFAEVKAAVGDYGEGKQVLFHAIEGPEVTIDEIHYVGNKAFEPGDWKGRMVSKESHLFSSTPFVETTLEQDLVAIANFYRSEGYLDAVVSLRDIEFSPEKDEVTITIAIEEHDPYVLNKISITGGESFPPDRSVLQEKVRLKVGQPRREEDILRSQIAIRNYYLENAYYDAKVEVAREEDIPNRTTSIRFVITEGSPAKIRRIDVLGNTTTREDVIRRNFSVDPGGPLNSIELQKSLNRLRATTYFDPASLRYEVLDTEEPGVKDVVFHVKEGRTGSVRFSAGLTSDLGIVGTIDIEKRNFDLFDWPDRFSDIFGGGAFSGGGQTLRLILSPGTSYSEYRLAFTEPWFLGTYVFAGPSGDIEETPFSFGFDIFHTRFSRFDYRQTRTGFNISTGKTWRSTGREIDDVYRFRLGFTMENVNLDDFGDDAPSNAYYWEGSNEFRKIDVALRWNHIDIPGGLPGKGFEADLLYTLGGGLLGGDIQFNKIEAGGTVYFTLYKNEEGRRHLMHIRARAGWSEEFGDTIEVPLWERFYAGGRATVRGFEFGQVGPRAKGNPLTPEGEQEFEESFANGEGDPLGGQALWLLGLEYSFPVYEDMVRGVLFVDTGNVALDWSDDAIWNQWRGGVGVGVRVKIPIFGPTPVALDFTWPFQKRKNDKTQIFSFAIDRPF